MANEDIFNRLYNETVNSGDIPPALLPLIKSALSLLSKTKVNILITGPTGCGKSSTINAMFGKEVAKVGRTPAPETQEISLYNLNNLVLFDSPGLGDGEIADRIHSASIIKKLNEKDSSGNYLIDIVLVILDGSTRDLGTSYKLINEVIIPNLGTDKNRLLVAINQADVAMKGKGWDYSANKPLPELENFLEKKVISTKSRIKEATGIDIVNPIYYSAGDGKNKPYNLAKLLAHIMSVVNPNKRLSVAVNTNPERGVWFYNQTDNKTPYQDYNKNSSVNTYGEIIKESVKSGVEETCATIGGMIGGIFGNVGAKVGRTVGALIGKGIKKLFSWF